MSQSVCLNLRAGFVSNSSSSSFVVSAKAYDTVFDLAKTMIKVREWGKEDLKLLNILDKAVEDGKDTNTNISFSSANYDTYIIKTDSYLVQSCRNQSFEDEIEGIMYYENVYENPLIKKYMKDSDTYIAFDSIFDFWYPEYALTGRALSYETEYKSCKHYTEPLVIKELDQRLSYISKKDKFLIDLGVAVCPMCLLNRRKQLKYKKEKPC